MVKKIGDYELRTTLGQGTFSKVKLAVDLKTGEKWAIKVIDRKMLMRERMDDQLRREIAIMKVLSHDNIVKLREVLQTPKHIYMVMELVTGGELFDRIVQAKRFDENTARKFFQQIVDGVEYCHRQNVSHRDLKPENLLLAQNDVVKISDFGLSAMGKDRLLKTTCGTPNYVAPEVLYEKGYSGEPADVWSLGVILFVMLAGYLPFDDPNMDNLFRKIQKGKIEYPKWFSPDASSLLQRMLVTDPKKRISVHEIKQNKWFLVGYVDKYANAQRILVTNSQMEMAVRSHDSEHEIVDGPEEPIVAPVPLNAFELASRLTAGSLGGLVTPQHTVLAHTNFLSDKGDGMETVRILKKILEEMEIESKSKEESLNLKCLATRPGKGIITFAIRIHPTVSDKVALVEVNRYKGDILAFHDIYRQIVARFKSQSLTILS